MTVFLFVSTPPLRRASAFLSHGQPQERESWEASHFLFLFLPALNHYVCKHGVYSWYLVPLKNRTCLLPFGPKKNKQYLPIWPLKFSWATSSLTSSVCKDLHRTDSPSFIHCQYSSSMSRHLPRFSAHMWLSEHQGKSNFLLQLLPCSLVYSQRVQLCVPEWEVG